MGHLQLLSLTGIALAVAAAACGTDKDSYVRDNERLLEALPSVPGAERLTVEHNPYYEEHGGPPVGWTTNVIYEAAPEMTDREVMDFYLESMGEDWQPHVEEIPIVEVGTGERKGTAQLLYFTRGTAVMSVNTDNMYAGGPQTFEVAVDHRGAR